MSSVYRKPTGKVKRIDRPMISQEKYTKSKVRLGVLFNQFKQDGARLAAYHMESCDCPSCSAVEKLTPGSALGGWDERPISEVTENALRSVAEMKSLGDDAGAYLEAMTDHAEYMGILSEDVYDPKDTLIPDSAMGYAGIVVAIMGNDPTNSKWSDVMQADSGPDAGLKFGHGITRWFRMTYDLCGMLFSEYNGFVSEVDNTLPINLSAPMMLIKQWVLSEYSNGADTSFGHAGYYGEYATGIDPKDDSKSGYEIVDIEISEPTLPNPMDTGCLPTETFINWLNEHSTPSKSVIRKAFDELRSIGYGWVELETLSSKRIGDYNGNNVN